MPRPLTAVAVAFTLAAAAVFADEIEIRAAELAAAEDGIVLNADFEFELSARLEEALAQGVPLHFLVELECYRPRWYWLDARIGAATRSERVSFHALTHTYRVTTGTLHRSYPTVAEVVRAVSRVREWQVLPRGALRPDTMYTCYVRMRLDTAQLPRPFQVSALANREWVLASPWKRWEVNGGIALSEAPR
jgi:Domain of unknown function (DUF4390)